MRGELVGVDLSEKMLERAATLRAPGPAGGEPTPPSARPKLAGRTGAPGLLRLTFAFLCRAGAAGGDEVPVYSRLLSADLLTLRRDEVLPDGGRGAAAAAVSDGAVGAVELITAADVLVYFGQLTELLQAFASLMPAGVI